MAFNLPIVYWSTALTFGSFTERFDICRWLSPRQDVSFRVSGQNISSQTEHEALDELGLLVFLKRLFLELLLVQV